MPQHYIHTLDHVNPVPTSPPTVIVMVVALCSVQATEGTDFISLSCDYM